MPTVVAKALPSLQEITIDVSSDLKNPVKNMVDLVKILDLRCSMMLSHGPNHSLSKPFGYSKTSKL
jgi:hypothetical protein